MTTERALDLIRNALLVAGTAAGPVLAVALLTGLAVGILQTATQINEASIVFVLKLCALTGALIVAGPYILGVLVDYTHRSFAQIGEVAR